MISLPLDDVVYQFGFVVTSALVVLLVLEKSRIPGIVGLLILGILIGADGFGVLPEESAVSILGPVGLLYIMFVAGLEIDLGKVREHPKEAAVFGITAFLVTLVPVVAIGFVMGLDPAGALLLGAALSSHTLVSYPMLVKKNLNRRRAIVAATGGTLLTDTAALLLLVVTIRFAGEESGHFLGALVPILLLLALAAIAIWLVPALAERVMGSESTTLAEKALFALAVLMVLAIVADAIGTKDILGAFLAGLVLNRTLHQYPNTLSHLEFVGRMLLVPLFFIETGTRLELAVIFGSLDIWLIAAVLAAVIIAAKSATSWWSARHYGYGRGDLLAMAGLSFPQAAATLAIVITGQELGLVGADIVDAVIIVILMTCLIGPLLTLYATSKMKRG
jgi:Kef-type K+ transport system membrane component KefB